jgi:hypothetical protein
MEQIFDTTNQEMQNAYNLIARTNKSLKAEYALKKAK